MQQPKRPLRKKVPASLSVISEKEELPPKPIHTRYSSQNVPKHILDDTITATDRISVKQRAPSTASINNMTNTSSTTDLYLETKKRLVPDVSRYLY